MTVLLGVIAVMIGISLGLLGAGGAIVAVPAFVYLGGVPPTLASGYALFVVTIATSLVSIGYIRRRQVNWRAVLAFGLTTLVSIAVIRRFVLPALPETLGYLGETAILRDTVLMLAFSMILLAAGTGMLRLAHPPEGSDVARMSRLSLLGLVIGVVSGFLGVGGGFLMTPALVIWGRLDMRTSVGTSLVLMALNSLVGVTADLTGGVQYDWPLVLTFTALTTIGIVLGFFLSTRFHPQHLKRIFGWFIILIGVAVGIGEWWGGK